MIDSMLKIRNYKCIGDDYQGFDFIYPINIIIGKNNSGKSSFLDIVELFLMEDRKNDENNYLFSKKLTETDVSNGFRKGTSGGGIPGDHWEFGKRFVNQSMIVEIYKNTKSLKEFSLKIDNPSAEGLLSKVGTGLEIALRKYRTKRIRAERHILPDIDGDQPVKEDGQGATNIIQRFINKVELPSDLVEKDLLREMNRILEPDLRIDDIGVQQAGITWEIYLEESAKGKIALSKSGSGIQTILLVLIYLYLIPFIEKKPINNYFYLFEELENNIHPALLRRLFEYLRNFALENETYFFITTHSNVVIDSFSRDPKAQILHVKHDGKYASIKQVKAYTERKGIIDDLDIRASDLLQSNGIIWVEGPSDRIYLNHWINLYTKEELKENIHYQIVFYGGRLLAHLSANPTEDNESINILNVNSNCILLMDSDKTYRSAPLNLTKKRIMKEIESVQGYIWVTKCKEVENYIPLESIQLMLGTNTLPSIPQYKSVFDYLMKVNIKIGKKYFSNKVLFAENIREYITINNYLSRFDLRSQIKNVISTIKKWNGLK